jgi:DNA-binding SARP family transcriptional activator
MDDANYPRLAQSCADDASWPIMIRLLGNFRLLQAGQLVPVRAGGRTESLLAHLGLQYGRRVPREQIVQLLWPDSDLAHALHSLNTLVYTLHKLLSPAQQDAAPVLHQDGYYRLNVEAGIGVDVACFDQLVRNGDQSARAGDHASSLAAYEQAVDLYRGDLCIASGTQTIIERERLRASFLTLLTRLADQHYQAADYSRCLEHLWRLLARDPCREDAHRLVMRCYVRRGERAAALHHYQLCEDILRTECGVTPERATVELLEQIHSQPGKI